MTEQNHHDPAELDKLAEKFTVLPNDNPASDAKRAELIDKPAFGQVFSDNMAHMTWTKGEGWSDRRIEPYAPLKMDPGASVLHYAQECFEGLKAYRHADGSTWLFRPDANAERFQNSAKRLYLPELPIDDFIGSVAAPKRIRSSGALVVPMIRTGSKRTSSRRSTSAICGSSKCSGLRRLSWRT